MVFGYWMGSLLGQAMEMLLEKVQVLPRIRGRGFDCRIRTVLKERPGQGLATGGEDLGIVGQEVILDSHWEDARIW
jgi:hypothetical protein